MQTTICLGCGQPHPTASYCPDCERQAARIIERSHWPLESSLTAAALLAVEVAVRAHLGSLDGPVQTELANLANIIRAHLQRAIAPKAAVRASDDWLG